LPGVKQAIVLHFTGLAKVKHSNILGPFERYEENEVLGIRYLFHRGQTVQLTSLLCHLSGAPLLGRLLTLPANITHRLERIAMSPLSCSVTLYWAYKASQGQTL